MIELRSDTFTLPSEPMLAAISSAPLGNDGYGEDPTVNRLERLAAERLGKEAACLMPSGTMANLAALMAHAPRGTKVLVGAESDIYLYEAAGASVCGGIGYEPIANQPDGTLALRDLEAGFPDDPADPQFARPALICLENTQNRCGGVILPQDYQAAVADFARSRGVPVHLDGARVFNAAAGLSLPAAAVARYADSVQFCLSKGLCAPVGSVLAGGGEFISAARRIRKMLGGGMRQAGVIAAAGIIALEQMAERLADDHALARQLADRLAAIPDVEVLSVQTNIVLFRVRRQEFSADSFVAAARRAGLAISGFGHGRIRAVTHRDVSAADIERAVEIIRRLLAAGPGGRTARAAHAPFAARREGTV
jgi:threonine aldolase